MFSVFTIKLPFSWYSLFFTIKEFTAVLRINENKLKNQTNTFESISNSGKYNKEES